MTHSVEWCGGPEEVACAVSGAVVFRDRRDHWENGVLRLLGLSEDAGRAWVEDVAAQSTERSGKTFGEFSAEEKLDLLVSVSPNHFPMISPGMMPPAREAPPQGAGHLRALGQPVNCQWLSQIRDRPDLAVVGNWDLRHGVLIERHLEGWSLVREAAYDEGYFEGNVAGVGYGSYRGQGSWRAEKAIKLVRRIQGIASSLGQPLMMGTRLLDVGSGYGYFRKAAEGHGWVHHGVEVSRHAIRVAEDEYGLKTFAGTLQEFAGSRPAPFDVITLFDTIEHLTDPVALVRSVRDLLAPRGFCVIRTPNLAALELRVFGNWYHSLKLEHLHYFSPESLCWTLEQGGLSPVFLTSDSHLLAGFLGPALHRYARLLFGSDLFALGQNLA